ncbi:MAG: hypothetical protein KIT69_20945, partial [Propionibacteriaceae bacterium]|nr:hypothetical protein [Propionibacteriaceae bacterium]
MTKHSGIELEETPVLETPVPAAGEGGDQMGARTWWELLGAGRQAGHLQQQPMSELAATASPGVRLA